MEKNKRLELNKLSQEVFGVPSKWRTLLKKGKYVPDSVVNSNGQKSRVMRWSPYSLEELEEEMKNTLKQRNSQAQKEGVNEEVDTVNTDLIVK